MNDNEYTFADICKAAAEDPEWDVSDEIREMPYYLGAMMLWF